MSVEKDSSIENIYIKLLDEGVDVWRPVTAFRLSRNIYKICDQNIPSEEQWEFLPGDIVRTSECKIHDVYQIIANEKLA